MIGSDGGSSYLQAALLLKAAADQSDENASPFAEWVPLIVAVVGAVSAIAVAFWNTRGESAALKRLKGMNEALAGLPSGEPVALGFAAARDLLAERIATRITGPSWWRKFWLWALGFAVGVAIVAGVWGLTVLFPGLLANGGDFIAVFAALLGGVAAATVGTGAWWQSRESEKRRAEVEAEIANYRRGPNRP